MLKLEPTEARNVLMPMITDSVVADLCDEVDSLSRSRGIEAARRIIDKEVLEMRLGLSASDCELLRQGAHILGDRRRQRGRGQRRVA